MVQKMSYFCTLDPLNDALNIITVCVEGRAANVVTSSVILQQTKKAKQQHNAKSTPNFKP